MARIKLIEEAEHPELAALIEKIRGARGGRLIQIYRLMLHSPALANAWFELNQAVRYGTEIQGSCRELAIMRVAIVNEVPYVLRAHEAIALREGLTREQLDALAQWEGSNVFSRKERALLAYADQVTRRVEVPDEVFAELKIHFTERQILELTMLIGAYNMLTRILQALRVDPEPPARTVAT
ncbi:MAG TPA: carboxymuconolactone decarboxylase family protein [Candidatus Eisenbacteria bacterium]|nr:carboxymuconolactone decarboxylase family protein [Candidatus Eisenbacteria bacterium]